MKRSKQRKRKKKKKTSQKEKITLVTRLHSHPCSSKSAKFYVNEARGPATIDATTEPSPRCKVVLMNVKHLRCRVNKDDDIRLLLSLRWIPSFLLHGPIWPRSAYRRAAFTPSRENQLKPHFFPFIHLLNFIYLFSPLLIPAFFCPHAYFVLNIFKAFLLCLTHLLHFN